MLDKTNKQQKLNNLIKLASWASVFVATGLLILKVFAWFATDSVSVLASLIDSLLDLFASLLNMFAIRYAMVPADDEHRFGHGKAESLAGLGQALFISSSGLFLIVHSIERMVTPTELRSIDVGGMIVGASLVVTLALVIFQRYVASTTGSLAIKADSVHYATDLISNTGVLIGLLLYQQGFISADPIVALLISIYILMSAFEIGDEALRHLLDHELPDEEKKQILEIASSPDEVIEVHDLRTRQSGRTKIIQLHLVLHGDTPLTEAHEISDNVEMLINQAFDDVDVLIHLDPHTEIQDEQLLEP